MAGHSKWANTKHRKLRQDGLRQKAWEKLLKEIRVATKLQGGNPDSNPRLRAAIAKAKSQSLALKNIESVIKSALGEKEVNSHEEFTYEGYGHEGVAFIVTTLSDNKARTVADVRLVFSKYGGQMGESGSVAWSFDYQTYVVISRNDIDEEKLFELLLDCGVVDFEIQDDVYEISSAPASFGTLLNLLSQNSIEPLHAELTYNAQTPMQISEEAYKKNELMKLKFEELDDVQEVYHNMDMNGEIDL